MAEHFTGREHTVHFSNGAAEELIRAWIGIGEKFEPSPHTAAVLQFLRDRLQRGSGWRSFPLDPPPPELAEPDRFRSFAAMNAGFADDLARGRPDPGLDVGWDRELQLSWLARLVELHDALDAARPTGTDPLPPLAPALSEADQGWCDFHRLANRLAEHSRRVERGWEPRNDRDTLAMLDRILAGLRGMEPSPARDSLLAHYLTSRSELLLNQGERAAGLAALAEAVAVEPDPALRESMADCLATMKEIHEA